jgi:hypothetical protein
MDLAQKQIKDFNVRPTITNIYEEDIGKILKDTGIGNDFLSRILITQELRARIDKWDCIKLKSFCKAQEIITRVKR